LTEDQPVKLPREQLYNELWEISAVGISKKYNVTYAKLLRICKDNDIPIPPSGYWTQLRHGKPVNKTPLPESAITEVTLSNDPKPKSPKPTNPTSAPTKVKEPEQKTRKQPTGTATQASRERFIHRTVDGKYNTYNRDKLYEEVWANPVIEVALQYGVSDVMIHKICKSLNVPVPPRGYWSRVRAGEKLSKTPLPATKGIKEITGAINFEAIKVSDSSIQLLAFLSEEERQKVLLAAEQFTIPDETAPIHNKIKAYKSVVKEWNKKNYKDEGAKRSISSYSYGNSPPFLAGVISDETLPRVYRILDALFRKVENLGGSVNDDLSLQVRNEIVHLQIAEGQDEIEHVMTRIEAQEIIVYEDAKRRNTWASKPQIRKYDYVFNGRLRISIRQNKYFRDTDKATVESRLSDILIDLYEESEVIRIAREAREEAERKRQEEVRQREERRNLYNNEIERTIALENAALDYDKACRIRSYIKAVEMACSQDRLDDETMAWIDWAKKKADWFDPTVARNDEFLGRRKHKESDDQKTLKKNWQYW